uniref:UNC93-like protein MFSD11 n=1 Tax=Ditylenchus dipsaci TaxID=166011 RepID=A0A915DRS4_9BILA
MLTANTINVLQSGLEETVINSFAGRGVAKHDGYTSLSITYAVFTVVNFVAAPIVEFLNPKNALVFGGFGAAVLWTAQGKYLAINSTVETAGKHSGLFWAISQISIIFGGTFLLIVFHFTDSFTDAAISVLYGVFTGVTLLGIVVLESTFQLLKTKRMLMLISAFGYVGVSLSFWMGIYPTCIASTQRLGSNTRVLLASNAIVSGFGQVSSAPLGKTDAIGFIEPRMLIALPVGFLLGFGDAAWNTQIYAILVSKYSDQSAQAFSIFKFFMHVMTSACFLYSKHIELHWHLLILFVVAIVGCITFYMAEHTSEAAAE